MTSYIEALTAAMKGLPPGEIEVVVGTVMSPSPLTISFAGSEPIAADCTSAFDLLRSSGLNLTGRTILIALPSGQPVVIDAIMEG